MIGTLRALRAGTIDQSTGRLFYGWRIVAVGIVLLVLTQGLVNQAFGAYLVLLQSDFGWSKTMLSFGYAFSRVESGVLGPFQGWLLDRYGPRRVMTVGLVIYGIGFIAFSRISTPLAFFATFAMVSVGANFGGFMALQVAVVNWFDEKRSMALILLSVGLSLAGFAAAGVIFTLDYFHWRAVSMMSGVLVLLVGVPLAQLVRHRPEDVGMLPDGRLPVTAELHSSDVLPSPPDFTTRQALRTSAFWYLSFGHAAGVLVVGAIMVHLIPHLTEGLGYSLSRASFVAFLIPIAMLAGRLIAAFVVERYDNRPVVVAAMFGHAGALLLLAYAQAMWMVIAFALILGASWATRGPLTQAMRADYFGRSSFGTIMGFSSLIIMIGSIAGPIIAGISADRTGDYRFGFTLLAVLAGIGSVFFALARPPARPIAAPAQPPPGSSVEAPLRR